MNRSRLEEVLKGANDTRILVLGDLMVDEYLWGRTERISPEAPVQVVDVVREELRLGGAGNVLNTLLTLGCKLEVASVVGSDADGELLRNLIREMGVGSDAVLNSAIRKTTRKTRVLASNQQVLRIDRESRSDISGEECRQLFELVKPMIENCDLCLISDYRKGVLTSELLQQVIELCQQHGKQVLVDPKGDDFSIYKGATLITPNRKEAQVALNRTFADTDDLLSGGKELLDSLSLTAVVMTRSEEGMSIFEAGGVVNHLSTVAREVYDVSGAGDTVLSLLGLGMARGLSVVEASELANIAAGIVVGKVGTSTVTPEEILFADGAARSAGEQKITDRQNLRGITSRLREEGKKVVFTNGCFDLIHFGHVQYLQEAKALGDVLILGLNSDASVQRLKGDKRPLISQAERAHILAALNCIDYVVIFDEDTPLELIEAVTPDILVKGGDYSPETVVGREHVEKHGGKVEIIRFVDGRSTTSLVEKVLAAYGKEE